MQHIDLGHMVSLFMWSCGLNATTRIQSHLDRAFSNVEWRTRFPEAFVRLLPKYKFNHSLVLIRLDGQIRNKHHYCPFWFQAVCPFHKDFEKFFAKNQNDIIPIQEALHHFIDTAKDQNRSMFVNIFARKRRVMARLEGVQ